MSEDAAKPSTKRSPREVAAEVFASLMWGPKSIGEVADVVFGSNAHSGASIVKRYLDEFKASGVVYVSGQTPRGHPRYSLNSKPFEHDDVPVVKPSRRELLALGAIQGKQARLFTLGEEQISLNEAAARCGRTYQQLYNRVCVRGMSLAEAMSKRDGRWAE